MPTAQVVKSATWLATEMGLFHATAELRVCSRQSMAAGFTNRTSFTIEVGEEVTLSLNLEGVQVNYWEVDANSDFIDGFEFVSDAIPPGVLEGPFQRA